MMRWLGSLLMGLCLAASLGCTATPYVTGPRPADADEWEYLVVSSKAVFGAPTKQQPASGSAPVFPQEATALQAALDKLGYEGWEVASVVGSYDGDQEFVLKRRKKKAASDTSSGAESKTSSSSL